MEAQRLLNVALDAKLSLATDPAAFLLRLHEATAADSTVEEAAADNDSLDLDFNADESSISLSLSLPDSFDNDVSAEYMLKVKDAFQFRTASLAAQRPLYQGDPRGSAVEGQLRNEIAQLKSQLQEKLDNLHGLEVSEAGYLELRNRPLASLSIREVALLRLGDVITPLRRELDQMHLSLDEYKAALQTSSLTVELQMGEMERQRRTAEQTAGGLRLDKMSAEATVAGLTEQLEREIALRRTTDEKAAMFDAAATELRKLQSENAELRSIVDKKEALLMQVVESESAARRSAGDMLRERESLALDKEYLSGEVRELQRRLDAAERDADAGRSRGVTLEVRLSELTDELLAVQRTSRTEAQERLERELLRLREDSVREIESMKAATREIVDRENRVLREARDGAEAEVRRLQAQLARLTEGSAAYERSASAQASAREVELTSLRGDLRIKAFELASLSTVFEERSSELRQARTELDLVRAEVAAHRNALQQLERAGEVQVLQLSSELESAKSRLAVYASWEREMDEAVVHAAKTSDPVDRRTALGALTGGPVNYDRRIAQVVQLAQKLRLCEVTGEQQAREILSLRDELAAARRDVERSALDSERSMQPASYLVQRLRETEEFVEGAKAKCAELEKTLSTCARQLSLAEGERDDVRERLSVVLQQREELDGMRRALEELRQRALDEEQEQEDSLNESQEQSPPLLADHPVYPDPSAASGMLGLSAELMSRLTTPLRHKDSGKKWHKRVVLD